MVMSNKQGWEYLYSTADKSALCSSLIFHLFLLFPLGALGIRESLSFTSVSYIYTVGRTS
jgi:hypothetical protein